MEQNLDVSIRNSRWQPSQSKFNIGPYGKIFLSGLVTDITEILLKVALNAINFTKSTLNMKMPIQ
jgi:hypothetical protein